jgi:hypothetical protein
LWEALKEGPLWITLLLEKEIIESSCAIQNVWELGNEKK